MYGGFCNRLEDQTLADAITDRMAHNARGFTMKGEPQGEKQIFFTGRFGQASQSQCSPGH